MVFGDMKATNKKLRPQKKRRRPNYRKIALVILPLCFILGIIYIVNASKYDPYFNLEKIEVKGNIYLDYNDVVVGAGVAPGMNINTIKIEKIKDNLLNIPRIKSARIIKEFPDKLVIIINEVDQIGLYLNGGELLEITENGRLFPVKPGVTEFDNPIIIGPEKDSPEYKLLKWDFVEFINTLKFKTELFNLVSEINFMDKHCIKVYLRNGRCALLRKDIFSLDLRRLEIIINSFELKDKKVIDLRFSTRAYLRE